jgi:hypothetical protein
VDCRLADHSRELAVSGVHNNVLTLRDRLVRAANRRDPEISLFVNVADNQANLIGVAADRDCRLPPFENGDCVSVFVGSNRVGVLRNVLDPGLLSRCLVARRSVGLK